MTVINPMLEIHRILCPVDFYEPSERALKYALARLPASLVTR